MCALARDRHPSTCKGGPVEYVRASVACGERCTCISGSTHPDVVHTIFDSAITIDMLQIESVATVARALPGHSQLTCSTPSRLMREYLPTISSTSQRHLSDIPMPAFRTQPSHVPTVVHAHQPTSPPPLDVAFFGCRITHRPLDFPTTTFPIARAHHLNDISATFQ